MNGFRTTGIYPLNRERVMSKISKPESSTHLVSTMVLEHLSQLREVSAINPGAARQAKIIQVSPGKSVSMHDITAGLSGI